MDKNKKAVWGWAIYDWANSAFATAVMAGFFPIFFKEYWSYGADVNMSSARLGFGNSIAGIIVAVLAPVLGAIADKGSVKKKFLIFFAYLGVLMTAALFLVQKGDWAWAIFFYVMGIIGFSGANIFYDSLLPSVADEDQIDYISGLGYAMGYLGGGLLFLVTVFMTLLPEKFGLSDAGTAVRYAFILVASWWGLFTIFTILWVQEEQTATTPPRGVRFIADGFRQLIGTFKKFRHLKTVLLFLVAYWFYIDGVDTIIRMAVDYGMSIGFSSNDLIVALLITQFVGFPSALIFGKLGQRWSVRKSIFIAIGIYEFITIWGTMMTTQQEFYILAIIVGLVQGGIQALSRSYYSRLIPKNQAAEYYGFYNMVGKFATILGPVLMGIVGLIARRVLMPPFATPEQIVHVGQLASRWGITSISLLFIIGAILFFFVDEEKGRIEAAYLSEI
ncbi:MAG: MFS transporter [Deltaproteobacteria bacterium]|nr:MFS transporter [Deltaproteobacteria bacterium]MBW2013665.1 MFS transporter [Deltaproteobacteria bacterium]MBW2319917.1 MFS transporter [Deltaproteobacteria bacterium]